MRYSSLLRVSKLFACLLMISCVGQQRSVVPTQRSSDFKVSVTTDGKVVQNYSQRLVRRLVIDSSELLRLNEELTTLQDVIGQPERHVSGDVTGLRLQAIGSGFVKFLGLKQGDLVTAIDKKHATSVQQFASLFEELRKGNDASLTLQRDGMPHKIYYRVVESPSSVPSVQ